MSSGKVRVRMDGQVKEVPAYIHVEDSYYDFQGLGSVPSIQKLTPLPIPGYRFLEVMGDVRWVAYKVNEYE